MGRRVKKEVRTIKGMPENNFLQKLEQVRQHRSNVANGIEGWTERELQEQERQLERWRESAREIEELHKIFPRAKWVEDIATGLGMDMIEVGWSSVLMSDEELCEAATEARNIYKDVEIDLNFGSKLSREQVGSLVHVLNEKCFFEQQSVDDVAALFLCEHKAPVKVKSNALVSYFFGELCRDGWICQNWQKVAEERKCFVGLRGNLLTRKTLSNAPTKYCRARGMQTTAILEKAIYEAVRQLKR